MSRTTKPAGAKRRKKGGAPVRVAEEPFLSRWSRRKREARATATTLVAGAGESTTSTPPKPRAPERVLTDADMPPIESLQEDSDYSLFLSPGVSEKLRRAALRKLFHSPGFNELCPLEGEYFDAAGFTPLGDVVTQEMRAALEKEAQALKDKLGNVPAADSKEPATPTESPTADIAKAEAPEQPASAEHADDTVAAGDDAPARQLRGHLRRQVRRPAGSHT